MLLCKFRLPAGIPRAARRYHPVRVIIASDDAGHLKEGTGRPRQDNRESHLVAIRISGKAIYCHSAKGFN